MRCENGRTQRSTYLLRPSGSTNGERLRLAEAGDRGRRSPSVSDTEAEAEEADEESAIFFSSSDSNSRR